MVDLKLTEPTVPVWLDCDPGHDVSCRRHHVVWCEGAMMNLHAS